MLVSMIKEILTHYYSGGLLTGAIYENRHRDHLDCIMFAGIRFATTLRLSTDVDLLVLDGKKVSSSLLRGADSIELDNGPHQLVFRVEDDSSFNSEERLYISPPLVVSFNTQLISSQFSPASHGE